MWPLLLDMTKEESMQSLRCLELEAYAGLVTALRAQGPLNAEKSKLLKDTGSALNISQDRHKAEVRRAVNDEKLNTIAYHISGQKVTSDEWAQEGRRLVPLMPRIAPQTAYAAIADEVADVASKTNKQLPNPASTERKRPAPVLTQTVASDGKTLQFRMPEPPKSDDAKKRKLPVPMENSTLAQHLMGPPKISRIQQIYRQKTKARQTEQLQLKLKQEQEKQDVHEMKQKVTHQQKLQQKLPSAQQNSQSSSPKLNALQGQEEDSEMKAEPNGSIVPKGIDLNRLSPQPGCSNENQAPKIKTAVASTKINQHITLKHITSSPGPSGEKQMKMCTPRKTITTKSITSGQKLIVVSNPQTITTPSILQRTLTIPFVKNISVKNLDKFKIVTTSNASSIQLSPLTATAFSGNPSKHKVVTVRTNPTVKKVIPLSQLQVLNAKGGIKVLPIGGKIVTKSNINTGSAPVYIVNSSSMQCLTKSTTSTPIIMTCKTQDNDKSLLFVKNPEVPVITDSTTDEQTECVDANMNTEDIADKSNVLADIMQAVGVVPSDAESYMDIENEITQHTIKNNTECMEQTQMIADQSVLIKEEIDSGNESLLQTLEAEDNFVAPSNGDAYCITDQKTVVANEECEELNTVGNLDPSTGLYSLSNAEHGGKKVVPKEEQNLEPPDVPPNINPND